MSASHGCNDGTDVVESLKEALKQRVGADRYQMWFAHGVDFSIDAHDCDSAAVDGAIRGTVLLRVRGQFALDRLRKNFLREIRGAAMQACGASMTVELCLNEPPAEQAELPLSDSTQQSDSSVPADSCRSGGDKKQQGTQPTSSKPTRHRRFRQPGRGKTQSLSTLIADGAVVTRGKTKQTSNTASSPDQLPLPNLACDAVVAASDPKEAAKEADQQDGVKSRVAMTAANFVQGPSNQLAHTAMVMVCQNPGTASPLFISGPTGTGKTHILAAIADQLRRRHRMRRVIHLSAEQFTNDFISSVGNSGITAFRRRYRDVDALLIDDVQFLGSKKATLREMLYTVETLATAGRPLVFSGLQSPAEIQGLSGELAGRMSAGLVCPIQPIDMATREVILRRWNEARCPIPVPDHMIEQINPILAGDGRVISGVVNLINTLQRMFGRMPTMDELRRFGGQLLRTAKPIATLSVIELAVCETFQLQSDTLRGGSQTRAVTEPRMLAMYLSRLHTSTAYAEIARHFGGKSHSTAIAAENNVKSWLEKGKAIGRGHAAMSAQEAIDRVESRLRCG